MIAIGQIGRSVGIKGEVKVAALTDRPERFVGLDHVWIGFTDETAEQFEVETVRLRKSDVVLKLKNVDSRNASDEERGKYLFVPDEKVVKTDKGSYFIHDLVGLSAVTEGGEVIGVVEDIVRLPGGDTWVLRSGSKEIMVPGVKEFIRSVDLQAKKVVIHAMEGLWD